MATSQRSALANRLQSSRGLYSARSAPSRRGARKRTSLQAVSLLVLVVGSLDGSAAMTLNAGLFGVFIASIWILGEGLRAEDHWRDRFAARACP